MTQDSSQCLEELQKAICDNRSLCYATDLYLKYSKAHLEENYGMIYDFLKGCVWVDIVIQEDNRQKLQRASPRDSCLKWNGKMQLYCVKTSLENDILKFKQEILKCSAGPYPAYAEQPLK